MSGVPPVKRIQAKDVPGSPAWTERLYALLNQQFDFLVAAFAKGITIQDNVRGLYKDLQITTGADYDDGVFTVVSFETGLTDVLECRVCQVIDRDFPDAVLSGPFSCDWRASSGRVSIRWVSGLEVSHRYFLRVWSG